MLEKIKFFNLMTIFVIFLIMVFNPCLTLADGVSIGIGGNIIPEPGQKAVIVWDKDLEKETLILSASFEINSLSDFCWIVPIHSSEDPNVRASDNKIFDFLEDKFPVYTRWDGLKYPVYGGGSYPDQSIEVIRIQEIGAYDIATIWANDPNILTGWLLANGYNVPSGFSGVVDNYTEETGGAYFIANKIDIGNEFADALSALQTYSPTIYSDLMSNNIDLDDIYDVVDSLTYELAKNIKDLPYDANSFAGHIMEQSEYEDLRTDWLDGTITTSTDLRSKVRPYIISSEMFKTIISLFSGGGTPIEIVFYPEEPTYPLYISSLASNDGGIDVYFIGPYSVEDENDILVYWNSLELSSSDRSNLENLGDIDIPDSCRNVTLLIYRGYMDKLDNDSVFVKYSPPITNTVFVPVPYYPPYGYPYSYPYSFSGTYPYTNLYSNPAYNIYNPLLNSTYYKFPSIYGSLYSSSYLGWPYGSSLFGVPHTGRLGWPYGSFFIGSGSFYGGGFYAGSLGGAYLGRPYGFGLYGINFYPGRWP
ncbi:DUF2330 domain-containing protein [bacterium]|nr:DUF2330 domain-containing protein [bacterium]